MRRTDDKHKNRKKTDDMLEMMREAACVKRRATSPYSAIAKSLPRGDVTNAAAKLYTDKP